MVNVRPVADNTVGVFSNVNGVLLAVPYDKIVEPLKTFTSGAI